MAKSFSKHNFNLYVLNVIIGLQKGHLHLAPYAQEFTKLGYQLFSIERTFPVSSLGTITPELIINSSIISNTLLFESSLGDVSYKYLSKNSNGHSQIDRYGKIEKDLLKNIAAVPKESLNSFDVVFIVNDKHLKSYKSYFSLNSLPFITLSFSYIAEKKQYCLKKEANSFSSEQVDNFFSNKILFSRVPAYINLDLSDLNNTKEEFFSSCALSLLKFLHKKNKGEEFTSTAIAQEAFDRHLWKLLPVEKQKMIVAATTKFLEIILSKFELIRTNFFNKTGKTKNTFKILLNDKNKSIEIQKINKRIIQFAHEEASDVINNQLLLFDDY